MTCACSALTSFVELNKPIEIAARSQDSQTYNRERRLPVNFLPVVLGGNVWIGLILVSTG
jgi:hypothetical protein